MAEEYENLGGSNILAFSFDQSLQMVQIERCKHFLNCRLLHEHNLKK